MTTFPPVLLVGGGRMGSALLAGWRESELSSVIVVDPSASAAALADVGVTVVASAAGIPAGFTPQAVVLAVKPQAAADVLPDYARFAGDAVFISIMAGKSLRAMGGLLGAGAAVVRAMPNTPAAVRQSFTVAVAAANVPAAQRELAAQLLTAIGQVAWVEAENLLDAVTAISGGGPAYVFLLTELMEQAAVEQGIPADLARTLARQTVIGSAAMLTASAEDAAALRVAVTSPKGTTEQALDVLRSEGAWPDLFSKAIAAATQRSRELGD